jgi:hypothetical protein
MWNIYLTGQETGVISRPNEYRSAFTLYKAVMPLTTDGHLTDCHSYSNQFLWIRMESHRVPNNFGLLFSTVKRASCIFSRREAWQSK